MRGVLKKFILISFIIANWDTFVVNIYGQETVNHFRKIEIVQDTFKLVPIMDSTSWNVIRYPPVVSNLNSFQDSLVMLKSLLSFQGDSSICYMVPMNWTSSNPNRTNYFVPDSANYMHITIEIEALFIFNLIIEPKPFWIATYPRLQAKKLGAPAFDKMFSLHDERLKVIYDYYWAWLKKCESAGTFNIGYYPLDKTNYSWL